MAKRTIADIEKIWSNVEGVKKLSDRAIGIGPFGIGMDGLLTWVPVVGTLYTVGAAGWLMAQAVRVRATPATLARMSAFLGADLVTTVTGEAIPFVPSIVDVLFPGHLMAAKALQKHIETTHWVEANEIDARRSGEHERHIDAMRQDPKKRRVGYLHR